MNRLTLLVVVLLVLLAAVLMTSCAPGPNSAVAGWIPKSWAENHVSRGRGSPLGLSSV